MYCDSFVGRCSNVSQRMVMVIEWGEGGGGHATDDRWRAIFLRRLPAKLPKGPSLECISVRRPKTSSTHQMSWKLEKKLALILCVYGHKASSMDAIKVGVKWIWCQNVAVISYLIYKIVLELVIRILNNVDATWISIFYTEILV